MVGAFCEIAAQNQILRQASFDLCQERIKLQARKAGAGNQWVLPFTASYSHVVTSENALGS
jgi:hypothetical protein